MGFGFCVCKTGYPVINNQVYELDDDKNNNKNDDNKEEDERYQNELPSKRKTYKKLKSNHMSPSMRSKQGLSFVSTEIFIRNKTKKSNNEVSPFQESQFQSKIPVIPSDNPNNGETGYSFKEFTAQEEQSLIKLLKNHPLFNAFTTIEIDKLIEAITVCPLDNEEIIFQEGEEATTFYIVKSGQIELYSDNCSNTSLLVNDCFGEIALITSNDIILRKYTAKAKSKLDTEIYALDKSIYLNIINDKNEDQRKSILNECLWFSSLTKPEQNNIIKLSLIEDYSKDTCVKRKHGKDISLVLKGSINAIYNKKSFWFYGKKSYINFFLLLSNKINEKIVYKTNENTVLLTIEEKAFIEVLGFEYREIIKRTLLESIFNRDILLSAIQKECQIDYKDLIFAFKLNEYKTDEIVYSKGIECAHKLTLLINGEIALGKNESLPIASQGDTINSLLLFTNQEFEYDYIAKNHLIVFQTTLDVLKTIIKSYAKIPDYIIKLETMLLSFKLFRTLPLNTIFSLSKYIQLSSFTQNDVIIKSDQSVDSLYLLAKGVLKVYSSDQKTKLRIIEEGNSFCEHCVLMNKNSTNNIIAKTDGILYLLPKIHFDKILEDAKVNNYIKMKIIQEDFDISLNDLYYISYLGRGRFGNVSLVHNGVCFYALKGISKSSAEKQTNGIKFIMSEKKTLQSLDHPFVVKLIKTLKNDNWCFFLMEYISGKNFDDYLNTRRTKKNIQEIKFYSTSIFLAISYIHSKKIIHRDIKPSNIMIDKNGYIKIIDFGTALKDKEQTKTIIGTPNYVAPEVLCGRGYSIACDYWSIGVCLYFIYYGILPFGHSSLELTDTYKEIIENEITFPDKANIEINSLISSLLTKNEKTRYSDIKTIKNHILFKDFNWDDLLTGKMKPFYIPRNDGREKEENLNNFNLLFSTFIDNERYDTKQNVTLKIGNKKTLTKNTSYGDNWFQDF